MACSGYRRFDPTLIYVLLALLVILGLTIASPFISRLFDTLSADLASRRLEAAFQDVQHPDGTERLSAQTARGNFYGEQGWDLFVGEIRCYEGNEETVLSAYAEQVVDGRAISVLFLENGEIPVETSHSFPEALSDIAAWGLDPDTRQEPLYMVYVMISTQAGSGR